LTTYLIAISVIGASVLACVMAQPGALDVWHRPWIVLPLALVIVIGELRPISIARAQCDADEVSVASTVGMALMLLAPLGVVMLAQILALVAYELRPTKQRTQAPLRLAFNIGQYTLAFAAARLVYCSLTGTKLITDVVHFSQNDVPAALVAAVAFYLVNSGLTSIAFGLSTGIRIPHQMRSDLRLQVMSSTMLLGLAPVVAQAELWSPWFLPFLLFPMIIVHQSAALATRREYEALHDGLTELPNRTLLLGHLERALQHRADGTTVTLMLLDLDHFKEINDTLGHAVGDRLIRDVAHRLRDVVDPAALVARLGGDEFAVVSTAAGPPGPAEEMAAHLSRALEEPFTAEGVTLDIGWSVGVACVPLHADSVDLLLQRADVALYAAKETRGAVASYDSTRDQHSVQRLTLAGDLRRMLETGGLEVYYQPQVHARTHAPTGVEALVRWRHPVLGWIDPEAIIALAASTGLIRSLTEQVMDASLGALSRWRASGHALTLSINLMPRQLADTTLPGLIATLLGRYSIASEDMVLEVTESTIMVESGATNSVLKALRSVGVGLSIDDFGTGYSSLAHLQSLAPDEIKIDRSFVSAMEEGHSERTIVSSTIELGHNLGMRIVAEGVESESIAKALANQGCDILQGYSIARPQDEAGMTRWLAARTSGTREGVGELARTSAELVALWEDS
jgi:diguanylate cyclase (GGDEF)-like protein